MNAEEFSGAFQKTKRSFVAVGRIKKEEPSPL